MEDAKAVRKIANDVVRKVRTIREMKDLYGGREAADSFVAHVLAAREAERSKALGSGERSRPP